MIRYNLVIIISVVALVIGIVLGLTAFKESEQEALSTALASNTELNGVTQNQPQYVDSTYNNSDAVYSRELSTELSTLQLRLEQIELQLTQHDKLLASLERESLSDGSELGENASTSLQSGESEITTPENQYSAGDKEAFIAAGLPSELAVNLETRFDEIELKRLYLRDQVRRDSGNSDEIAQQRQRIDAEEEALVEEIGDVYGNYLYLTGQTNQVSVDSVIGNSAAANGGIRDGDVIHSYADERIYNSFDLSSATAQGELGETVSVQVLRDEQIVERVSSTWPHGDYAL